MTSVAQDATELFSSKLLGCSYVYYTSKYDMCNGSYCNWDIDCASNCCFGSTCGNCGADLYWLWWTLSFFFLFLLIFALAAARRRRRMAMLRRIAERNHSDDSHHHHGSSGQVTAVVYAQVPQQQPGQPAMGMPVDQNEMYKQQMAYQNYQQQQAMQ